MKMQGSVLLLHAFILVIKAVEGARPILSREKGTHFILIEVHCANIFFIFFVIVVKNAGFAVYCNFFVFHFFNLLRTSSDLTIPIICEKNRIVKSFLRIWNFFELYIDLFDFFFFYIYIYIYYHYYPFYY